MFTHRVVCPQQKRRVINGAEPDFSTELIRSDFLSVDDFFEPRFPQAKKTAPRGAALCENTDAALFTDTEAREDASQQVVGTECPGDLP